jgi:hypothetical protein
MGCKEYLRGHFAVTGKLPALSDMKTAWYQEPRGPPIWKIQQQTTNPYIYIYIYAHTHTYIYKHTHIYIYTYTHTHTHICIYVYLSIYQSIYLSIYQSINLSIFQSFNLSILFYSNSNSNSNSILFYSILYTDISVIYICNMCIYIHIYKIMACV